ncbi:hypothetical protein Tco_0886443 [Tanacetum coccineum]
MSCHRSPSSLVLILGQMRMQRIAKVAIGGIRCGVCRQSGEERGIVLESLGSRMRTGQLKEMYSCSGYICRIGTLQFMSLSMSFYVIASNALRLQ